MQRHNLSERAYRVLRHLESQPGTRWPRQALRIATELPDRSIRIAIEELQAGGWPVLAAPDGTGYWLARTADEVADYLRQEDSRLRSMGRKVGVMRRTLSQMRAQEVEGVHHEPMRVALL